MLQFTARDARHFSEASQVLVSPQDYPQCAAWRAGVTAAVRVLFAADRALLLMSVQPDLAPGARIVAGIPHDAWWPAIAPASTALALHDSARRPGVRSEGRILVGPLAEEGRTTLRGWPPAVQLPLLSGTLRPARDVTAAGLDANLPTWAWVHIRAEAGAGGALLIVGSCGALSARFDETDALLLGAMLRPAFVAGARDARARWGPCRGALGNASRPITGGPDAVDPRTAPSSEPSSGIAMTLRSCDDARFASVRGSTGAPGTLAAAHLTAREHEIAALLAQRRTNREIAAALTITEHTARHHTERVLRKLGLSTRRDVPRP